LAEGSHVIFSTGCPFIADRVAIFTTSSIIDCSIIA